MADYLKRRIRFLWYPGTSIGSGNDLADFLMGLPDDFQEYPNAPTNIRSHSSADTCRTRGKSAPG